MVQLTQHKDSIFLFPTVWVTNLNKEVIFSISWLVFSLEFLIKTEEDG